MVPLCQRRWFGRATSQHSQPKPSLPSDPAGADRAASPRRLWRPRKSRLKHVSQRAEGRRASLGRRPAIVQRRRNERLLRRGWQANPAARRPAAAARPPALDVRMQSFVLKDAGRTDVIYAPAFPDTLPVIAVGKLPSIRFLAPWDEDKVNR